MATNKKNEAVEEPMGLAEMQAQMAQMLAEAQAAKAEAAKMLEEAKRLNGGNGVGGRMTPEEYEAYKAYMDEYVEVMLFKDNGKYKDDVFVAVNGEGCLIQRGVRVKIKRKFAEVLEESMKQDRETASLIDLKTSEWKRVSQNL